MKKLLLTISIVGSLLCASLSAGAVDPVTVSFTAKKVVAQAAKPESFAPATTAKPGDILLYEAAYQNTTPAAIHNLQATIPIPVGVEFVPESTSASVKAGAVSASLDGKEFAPLPLLRAKSAEGKTSQTPVPPGEYRAVRWSIPEIAAGSNVTVSLRSKVISNSPAATR